VRSSLAVALLLTTALTASAQTPSTQNPARPERVPSATSRQVVLQADTMEYDSGTETVSAIGRVEIATGGRILLADRVTYDQRNDRITATGNVSLTDSQGNVAFANSVVLTDEMRNGALTGFGALIGKNGRLAATSAQRRNGTVVIANRAVYSPCEICKEEGRRTPLWQVKSERVVYDQVAQKVRFRNASLEAFGVPVLYSPYLSMPTPDVRYSTGFLTPDIGNSSKFGYFARTPFYIALSPSRDLTLTPMISSLGGEVFEAEYRQRWNNSGLWFRGSLAYNADGGLGGAGAGPQFYDHLFGSGRIALGGNWRSGFDLQLTNNPGYMRFYDISFLDRLTSSLFLENMTGRSRLALTGYFFQGLRATDITAAIPYAAPLVEYSFIPSSNLLGGQFRFDLNGVGLHRGNGIDQQRVTAEMRWRLPLVMGAGQLWTFIADVRGDAYRLETPTATATLAAGSTTVTRAVPYAALDWRWPFIAEGRAGRSYVFSPIVQLVAQPYGGNPAALALRDEDSSNFEFSDINVFSFSRLPGYDLVESGYRANVGFSTEALFPGGSVQTMLGQTFRLKPDPIMSAFAGQTGTASDVVGRVSVKFANLTLNDRIDFDRRNGSINRHEVYLTGTRGRSSAQLSYVQLPAVASVGLPIREEINGQLDLNIWRNWQVFVAARRDMRADQFLDAEYGLGYEDECFGISLAYRRKYTADPLLGVPASTSIILRLSFKTGDEPIRPFSLFPADVFSNVHLN
jgi:LPS-assembly protein